MMPTSDCAPGCPCGGRTATAYHEAGHALACAVTGSPIEYVTLSPTDPRAAGQIRHLAAPENDALISAAGPVAEAIFRARREGGGFAKFLRFSLEHGGNDDYNRSRGIFARPDLVAALRTAIEDDWTGVDRLAVALLSRGTVYGGEAEALVSSGSRELVAA